MKVLLSPAFGTKLSAIPQDSVIKILDFVRECESLTRQEILDKSSFNISLLDENVYAVRLDAGRLFVTFEGEADSEYLVLLDFAAVESSPLLKGNFFASLNPKTNSSLNPKYNTAINPRYNTKINPKYNTAINPRYNTTINPKYNTAINPRYNTTINPKYNTAINPRYNTAINPKYNTAINPRFNRSYDGPYFYDLSLKQVGYIVKANDKIDLMFSIDNEFSGILVCANQNIRIRFDVNSKFTGYIVHANEQVCLLYSENNEWIGLLI